MSRPNIRPVYREPPVPGSHNYHFRGLFTCGFCGRQLVGERQKGHVYYRCHARSCPGSCVREEALTDAILDALAQMDTNEAAERLRAAGPQCFRPADE